MKQTLENLEQFAIAVVLERRQGKRATVLRSALLGLSQIYRGLVKLRLWLYSNRILRERNLGCLVVSIGNLTVGGTGKTPVVEKFARSLQDGGRKVAILSRGYKSVKPPLGERLATFLAGKQPEIDPPRVVSDGSRLLLDSKTAGDEPYMLASNLRNVVVITDKDRVKSGLHAIKKFNCDTLILDDGLQYLRLRHRLDIVLIDRYQPFGNEFLLPRGTLREPPKNLKRASYIFITKCTGAPGENDALKDRIRLYNRTAEIIECTHQPKYLENVASRERIPLDSLQNLEIGAVSGIAVPESFEGGLERLGARITIRRQFTDHHRYSEQEIITFINDCRDAGVKMIVTTEKDSVRFPRLNRFDVPMYFLRVEIGILSNEESFTECIDRICRPRPVPMAPARWFFSFF
ncbi:MAG: tetraacyldisaccharide 4'-kinase [Verrucomicrobia bacterium]|nr:tetraacyldisaccharide 4'-kinase [Verrucomicrobiota bacterium]